MSVVCGVVPNVGDQQAGERQNDEERADGDEDLGAARDASAGGEQDGLTEQEGNDGCLAETAQERDAQQNHRQRVSFAADEHKVLREEEREGAEKTDGHNRASSATGRVIEGTLPLSLVFAD